MAEKIRGVLVLPDDPDYNEQDDPLFWRAARRGAECFAASRGLTVTSVRVVDKTRMPDFTRMPPSPPWRRIAVIEATTTGQAT